MGGTDPSTNYVDSLLCMSFSMIFSILDRDIGLLYYRLQIQTNHLVQTVFDFCIGMTLAIFRTEGNCPAEKDIKNVT